MKGFLCITNAKNDEEYRARLKKQNIIFAVTTLIGIAVAAVATLAELNGWIDTPSRSLGFFAGIGAGIAGASIGFIIKNSVLMKDEKKLRAERIANSDERTAAIIDKTNSASLTVLVLTLGAVCLIGGIFYPVLIDVIVYAALIWAVSYIISYAVYNKKM